MKPCTICGERSCNHQVPKDLQEEFGTDIGNNQTPRDLITEYADMFGADEILQSAGVMAAGASAECNHGVPLNILCDDCKQIDEGQKAADKYYASTKKIIFVPVEITYNEPTDVIYGHSLNELQPNFLGKAHGLVEKAFKENPARQKILDEIKLYEEEKTELAGLVANSDDDEKLRDGNMKALQDAIRALQLVANKF